jgi:hypothetical protein
MHPYSINDFDIENIFCGQEMKEMQISQPVGLGPGPQHMGV